MTAEIMPEPELRFQNSLAHAGGSMEKLRTFLSGLFRAAPDEPRIQALKELSLFKSLSARELRELDELLHERSYEKDEIIFDEGDTGLGLFIVVNGRVK